MPRPIQFGRPRLPAAGRIATDRPAAVRAPEAQGAAATLPVAAQAAAATQLRTIVERLPEILVEKIHAGHVRWPEIPSQAPPLDSDWVPVQQYLNNRFTEPRTSFPSDILKTARIAETLAAMGEKPPSSDWCRHFFREAWRYGPYTDLPEILRMIGAWDKETNGGIVQLLLNDPELKGTPAALALLAHIDMSSDGPSSSIGLNRAHMLTGWRTLLQRIYGNPNSVNVNADSMLQFEMLTKWHATRAEERTKAAMWPYLLALMSTQTDAEGQLEILSVIRHLKVTSPIIDENLSKWMQQYRHPAHKLAAALCLSSKDEAFTLIMSMLDDQAMVATACEKLRAPSLEWRRHLSSEKAAVLRAKLLRWIPSPAATPSSSVAQIALGAVCIRTLSDLGLYRPVEDEAVLSDMFARAMRIVSGTNSKEDAHRVEAHFEILKYILATVRDNYVGHQLSTFQDMLINDIFAHVWPEVCEVLARFGYVDKIRSIVLSRLKTITYDPLVQRYGLEALCRLVTIAQPPRKQAGLKEDVRRVRAAALRARERWLAGAKGFDNGGRRHRNGEGLWGDQFETTREVPGDTAVFKHIDWSATARMGADRQAMGMVVERQKSAAGSRPTLIVLNPMLLAHLDRRDLSLCVGTIAQLAMQAGDPVGLVIGKHYLPPKRSESQLAHIITGIEKFQGIASDFPDELYDTHGQCAKLAEHIKLSAIRRHLRPGTLLIVVDDLVTRPPEEIEQADRHIRKYGAQPHFVGVRRDMPIPVPIIHTGQTDWVMSPQQVQSTVVPAIARTYLPRLQKILNRVGATMIDLPSVDVPNSTVTALMQETASIAAVVSENNLVAHTHENPEPSDIVARIRRAKGDAQKWESLLREAYVEGWRTPLEYAERTLYDAVFDTSLAMVVRVPSADARGSMSRPKYESGDNPYFHPELRHIADELARVERVKYSTVRRGLLAVKGFWSRLKSSDAETGWDATAQRPIGLADSGVMSRPRSRTFLKMRPAPKGRHRYLRHRTGINLDDSHLQPDPEFSPESLAEPGITNFRGKLGKNAPTGLTQFQMVGGGSLRVDGKVVTVTATGEQVSHPLLDMTVAEFRTRAPLMYGKELYDRMTAAPTLEEIAQVVPELVKQWTGLLAEIQALKVRDAFTHMQRWVEAESGLKYRGYNGDYVAETMWNSYKQRVDEGEAGVLDAIRLIATLGGGKCQEFSLLGLTLLRLAGIPTALTHGWLTTERGAIDATRYHAWPEMFLPHDNGKWTGVPVEMTPPYMGLSLTIPRLAAGKSSATDQEDAQKEETGKPPAVETETASLPGPAQHQQVAGDGYSTADHMTEQRLRGPDVLPARLAQLWANGTPTQRGDIRAALYALDLSIFQRARPRFGSDQTWGDYLDHNLGEFIRANSRPLEAVVHDATYGNPDKVFEVIRDFALRAVPDETLVTSRICAWNAAVKAYFGDGR